MKFDLISDFHVEHHPAPKGKNGGGYYYDWKAYKKSDVLVIAGDTSNHPRITSDVVRDAASFYETVLFIDGNHEHYIGQRSHKRAMTVGSVMRELYLDAPANALYLPATGNGFPGRAFPDGTIFIGCNGWYDWSIGDIPREAQHRNWKLESNDPRQIRFDPEGYPDKLARYQAEYLHEELSRIRQMGIAEQVVVVTHTVPSPKPFPGPGHPWYFLNGSYHNTHMIKVYQENNDLIKTWCFGHTHDEHDWFESGVRFVSNPRGYFQEGGKDRFYEPLQIDTDEKPVNYWSLFGGIE